MKIRFLGTNGWYSSLTGDTPCILIDSREHYIIFDAGNGIYKLDQYITENKPISMFISHFHLDHVSGLHTLAKFDFKQGIDIYIGEGRSNDFKMLVNPPFTIGYLPKPENIKNLKTEIRLHELAESSQDAPFHVTAIKQQHAYIGHGYKIELEGKTIAYTGDCGLTNAARKLANNADLLICECSNKEKTHPEWGHFNPTQAANLAKEERVKQLILTHFAPDDFPTLKDRKMAEETARKIFPKTIAATDGMEFNL